MTIGAIDARPPRAERPPTAPELEKRWQALKDERAALDDQIAAETARKKFAERFAAETPFGVGEKDERATDRGLADGVRCGRRGDQVGERRDPRAQAEAA